MVQSQIIGTDRETQVMVDKARDRVDLREYKVDENEVHISTLAWFAYPGHRWQAEP